MKTGVKVRGKFLGVPYKGVVADSRPISYPKAHNLYMVDISPIKVCGKWIQVIFVEEGQDEYEVVNG